ncbi:hypothetical protein [Ostreiculturibacter nitratireducens]|uniref:hypothetical protein n=1 Tax=Ostreiculturibacter nitratireducens TaxID=3075226 RepID=UPI0031B58A48
MISRFAHLLSLLVVLVAGGCAMSPDGPPPTQEQEISELAEEIRSFGPEVDPEEAQRAARIAFEYSHQLAREYQVTDPPLIHNTKVNLGLRPRGLCYQWADDLEARMRQEDFRTLALHRAIANSGNPLRIDHSTLIVSRSGDGMFEGVVLDPWRNGGDLHWSPTLEDSHYRWRPRAEVFEEQLRRQRLRERQTAAG